MAKNYGLTFSLLAVSVAAALSAQAATENTMVVSASGDGASDNTVAPYTNSATKSAVPESRTPQTINTISKQEIEKRHATSLNEILRYEAGVSSEMRGSTTYMSEYKIRGFGAEHEYYNGLQLPYNVSGSTKANIDPILIEQVDILKGPSSVLYGNASPGGLVNIQSKKPQKEQSTEVGFNTGNRKLREGYLDSTGQIADSDWNYRFIGKASAGDDQARTTKHESYLVAPTVTWQPSDQTRLTLEALYQDQPNLTPSNPFTVAYLRSGYASRRDYGGDNWNVFKQREWMLGYSFEHEFDNGWGVVQKARYFNVKTYQRSVYAYEQGSTVTDFTGFGYITDESVDSFNIDNQLTKTVEWGEWKHHLLAGFDYQHLSSNMYYQYGANNPGIDMRNPDYHRVVESGLGLYDALNDRLSYNQNGYYLQDQIEFGALNLVASLRYDDYRSTTAERLAGYSKTSVDQSRVTKRLGALYQFSSGIAPYVSYSEGFLPVSPIGTLSAAEAKPTTSKQLEGGVKYLLANYATTLTASVFQIKQKNVLTSDGTYDAVEGTNYRQTGEVESKGVELTAVSRPLDNLNLVASYAYTHAINTKDDLYQGQRAMQVPENAVSLWADYTFDNSFLNGLMLGAGMRYKGKTPVSQDNSVSAMGGNTQFDLAMAYDMGVLSSDLKGLTLKAGAQNITNKFTYTCYSSNACWIGRDRTWQVGMSYRF